VRGVSFPRRSNTQWDVIIKKVQYWI
jgi:hypothetical protein